MEKLQQRVISYFGGRTKLSKLLGVSYMTVKNWHEKGLPPVRAKQIADISCGEFSPQDILPKFFEMGAPPRIEPDKDVGYPSSPAGTGE